MASSGIQVDPNIQLLFNEIKLKHTKKYLILKVADDLKTVEIEKIGENTTTTKEEDKREWESVQALLSKEEPRYIIFDFRFPGKEGRKIEKLAFITWCCDDCNIKKKMLISSTKETVKKKLEGLKIVLDPHEFEELEYDCISKEVESKKV